MNKKYFRMTALWILTALCSLLLAMTAWAEGDTAAETADIAGTSRVVVSAAAAAREAEARAEAEQTLTGPAAGDTRQTEVSAETGRKGTSLGMFTTTGYCSGTCCGGGSGKTYSGTVPQANHTISADLDRFPLGTKVMIHDVIYTVEDMGSAVKGNWIDIYYDTHEEAAEHGMQTEEVFTVIPE